MTAQKETLGFQAEVKQLLHLMIHSLYCNKEIFLRELISNASDACDKLRFEALDQPGAVRGRRRTSRSASSFDKAARTLTITDNGIGMSRDEVIANLGTIAKSGTREFFAALTGDQAEGRAADRPVRRRLLFGVHRRRQGHGRRRAAPGCRPSRACAGSRDGGGEFTRRDRSTRAARGTDVTLHLREGEDEFLDGVAAARRSSASTPTTSRCRS